MAQKISRQAIEWPPPTQSTMIDFRVMAEGTLVVHSDPEILGGTPVFAGTRVPIRNLIDHLEAGDRLEDFLRSFPSVSREQAVAVLELAGEMLAARARSTR